MAVSIIDPGVIDPDRLYSFAAFKKATGIGTAGIREARKKGLQVRYDGRGGWILGRWWIDYIITNGRAERSSSDRTIEQTTEQALPKE